jgi:hypothetical protein
VDVVTGKVLLNGRLKNRDIVALMLYFQTLLVRWNGHACYMFGGPWIAHFRAVGTCWVSDPVDYARKVATWLGKASLGVG